MSAARGARLRDRSVRIWFAEARAKRGAERARAFGNALAAAERSYGYRVVGRQLAQVTRIGPRGGERGRILYLAGHEGAEIALPRTP